MKAVFYNKNGTINRVIPLNNCVTIDLFIIKDWCRNIVIEKDINNLTKKLNEEEK